MFSFVIALMLTGTSFVGQTADQAIASHTDAGLVQVERSDNGIAPAAVDVALAQTVAVPAPVAPAADKDLTHAGATMQGYCFYRWVLINGYWYYQYVCYG